MGQRSQIYFRNKKENVLVANYYQWNFADRMISRARHTLEWLNEHKQYISFEYKTLARIMDVNFDYHDIVMSSNLINEYIEWLLDVQKNIINKKLKYNKQPYTAKDIPIFKDDVFICTDNNDGKLFIEQIDDTFYFTFTDYDLNILSPNEYMNWDHPKWNDKNHKYKLDDELIKMVNDNLDYLNNTKYLKPMTQKQLDSFINDNYTEFLKEKIKLYKQKYNINLSTTGDKNDKKTR